MHNPKAKEMQSPLVMEKVLEKKIARNARYSVTAFARDLGISTAYLSQILNGRRKLNLEKAIDFCEKAGLSDEESCELLQAVVLDSASTTHLHGLVKSKLSDCERVEFVGFDMDHFMVIKDWHHSAILQLTTCDNFKADYEWMAQRLRLNPDVVQKAVERMMRLGLLVKTNKGFVKKHRYMSVKNDVPHAAIRAQYRQFLDKAGQELRVGSDTESFQRRKITGITLAFDPDKMDEIRQRIDKFIDELALFATSGHCREVYHLGLQFLPLTQADKKKD